MVKTVERGLSSAGRRLFPEGTWRSISGDVARAFGMGEAETASLAGNNIARLITALPFLAGCEDAKRTAVAHLGTFLLSIKETKPYFNATPRDSASLLERFWLIGDFRGGDRRIIERGMSLLALNMITDYQRDIVEDETLGKYNPIAARDFDFKSAIDSLEKTVQGIDCPEMDEIAPMRVFPMSWWVLGG